MLLLLLLDDRKLLLRMMTQSILSRSKSPASTAIATDNRAQLASAIAALPMLTVAARRHALHAGQRQQSSGHPEAGAR